MTTEKSSGNKGQYQKVKPITSKNLGKNYLKRYGSTNTYEPNGDREVARRLKQQAKREAKNG